MMPSSNLTREYLEEALKLAKRDLPGWAFAMIRSEATSREPDAEPIDKSHDIVQTSGPKGASIAFVGATPSRIDAARGRPFTGPAGETFRDSYLTPLALDTAAIIKTNAVPVVLADDGGRARQPTDDEVDEWREWLTKEIDRFDPRIVVALGQTAKNALGDRADFVLPHPSAIRRFGNKGEVSRKLRRIRKALAEPESRKVRITKADEEKQIVYGVVLSSYGKTGADADAHNDWMPPREIEETAHKWFSESRKIGINHPGMAGHTTNVDAEGVESHVEEYPPGEYAKAVRGEPHKVIRRKFGSDVAYSGDWILGAKLGDKSWAAYKRGDFNAFSPEGFGAKIRSTTDIMPEITFVDPS